MAALPEGISQAELWALQKKAHQSAVIASDLRARAAREDERAAEYRRQLGQEAGSEVEELAATLNDAMDPFYYPLDWHEATSIAANLLAAGYRRPQQVTSLAELDALPVGAIVLDSDPDALLKADVGWRSLVDPEEPFKSLSISLPAIVLHVGGAQ